MSEENKFILEDLFPQERNKFIDSYGTEYNDVQDVLINMLRKIIEI